MNWLGGLVAMSVALGAVGGTFAVLQLAFALERRFGPWVGLTAFFVPFLLGLYVFVSWGLAQ